MRRSILFLTILSFSLFSCTGKNEKTEGADLSGLEIGTEIGDIAPEIELKSPDGKKISLSSLRGKIVLIDFWASWCSPCRRENPNLVRIYKRFRDDSFIGGEGFTIYGVSMDKDRNAWIKAIEDDQLIWESQVSDLKGPASEAAATYGIMMIPYNYLIDGNGVILARNLKAEMLEKKLKELKK